jgi:hypothetical protein
VKEDHKQEQGDLLFVRIDQHKRLRSESFVTIKSKNEKANEVSSGVIFKVGNRNS